MSLPEPRTYVEPKDGFPQFSIGSDTWPGLAKLSEELGELQQVIGKIMAYPDDVHPDGGPPLHDRLVDEMGDVYAALDFLSHANSLVAGHIHRRRVAKFRRFTRWHRGLEG